MFSSHLNRPRYLLTFECTSRVFDFVHFARHFSSPCKKDPSACMRAHADIPPDNPNPQSLCTTPCKNVKKKPSILRRIKLSITEGGTNFSTPFRWLDCAWKAQVDHQSKLPAEPEPPLALPEPKPTICAMPEPRPGVQVSIIGANTQQGHYISLLLKQCSQIKKICLYQTCNQEPACGCCTNMFNVVQDLQHIDTNCGVEAFCCHDFGLQSSLQSTDIVLILDDDFPDPNMELHQRFHCLAPKIKRYADAIALSCPQAFVVVCTSPTDCMVPLIAETLKETGWYNPRKLLGSLAVPEMRASTLAARALCLEPRCARVPCVGGTHGATLVPLFSQAVDFFNFSKQSTEVMTDTVRNARLVVSRCEGPTTNAAALSEAFAVSRLVTNVANALLCLDVPRVTGFVETDASHVISPARFVATRLEINRSGINRYHDLPKMSDPEISLLTITMGELQNRLAMVQHWFEESKAAPNLDMSVKHFFKPDDGKFNECAYANVF